ncbi:MAG: hypothetical protein AB8B52_00780 [Winogradskyella sp.]|uniref:hypothetical protein n=1 Tax=Winogradskyella sp. TaxID=1883156 RepID=UPI00385BE144
MKPYTHYIFLLVLMLCNLKGAAQNETRKETLENECIFDQATQTDAFLKGIKELEGYKWDADSKTAEISLNDDWYLSLKRGGCDSFELSASFIYDRLLDFETDKQLIFDQVIWITNLIEGFDDEGIKSALNNNRISTEVLDEKVSIRFTDDMLSDFYYMIFQTEDDHSFITFSFYMD